MKLAVFGATGALGTECVTQALAAGHDLRVLVRNPDKLAADVRDRVHVVQGNGLDAGDVARTLESDVEAILFCIGIDRNSPEDLCTTATRHILDAMRSQGVRRLVWCGGGSNIVEDDVVTTGARFVRFFASTFMGLRHRDKVHQLELLATAHDVEWVGVRPLQMKRGPHRGVYRLGFHAFSGLSSITFADCADAMLRQLEDDSWLHKAPIVCY